MPYVLTSHLNLLGDVWIQHMFYKELRCMGILLCLSAIFTKGNNFYDYDSCWLPCMKDRDFLKWGLLLKKRIGSHRSQFFPLRVDTHLRRERKMKMGELLPLKVYPFMSVKIISVITNKYVAFTPLVQSTVRIIH